MARNPYNARRTVSLEWGSKARKEETRLRNLNHAADREAVEEGLAELDLVEDWG